MSKTSEVAAEWKEMLDRSIFDSFPGLRHEAFVAGAEWAKEMEDHKNSDLKRMMNLGMKYDIKPWNFHNLTPFGSWLETWLMKLGIFDTDPNYELARFWWLKQKLGLPYRRADIEGDW